MKCNAKIINLKDRVISFDDAIRLEDILNQVKDELPIPSIWQSSITLIVP